LSDDYPWRRRENGLSAAVAGPPGRLRAGLERLTGPDLGTKRLLDAVIAAGVRSLPTLAELLGARTVPMRAGVLRALADLSFGRASSTSCDVPSAAPASEGEGRIDHEQADLADTRSAERALERAIERHHGHDAVVATAGTGSCGRPAAPRTRRCSTRPRSPLGSPSRSSTSTPPRSASRRRRSRPARVRAWRDRDPPGRGERRAPLAGRALGGDRVRRAGGGPHRRGDGERARDRGRWARRLRRHRQRSASPATLRAVARQHPGAGKRPKRVPVGTMSAGASLCDERTVRLLEVDPDLAERIPLEQRAQAHEQALARMATLPRGPLTRELLDRSRSSVHGLLLLEGLVSRNVHLGDTTTIQLIGAGDLLEPAALPLTTTLVPVEVTWTVLEPASAALIDDDFVLSVHRWPELVVGLFERVGTQTARFGTHCAISQLSRVEDRIEALLWFLAERWGRVSKHGIVLPLRLTHETIGLMLGAKRPTVSLAVKRLEANGVLMRRNDGSWLLREPWTPPRHAEHGARVSEIRFADETTGDRWGTQAPSRLRSIPFGRSEVNKLQARVERMRGLHTKAREEIREPDDERCQP
jgi:CRP-like cAMP-binding protein